MTPGSVILGLPLLELRHIRWTRVRFRGGTKERLCVFKDRQFRIKRGTLGIMSIDELRRPVTIPQNATVEVTSHTRSDGMIDVVWEGRPLMMFEEDIRERGEEIKDAK